ncbi:MAG: hypothetical protein VR65_27445 [Desulfobulbaceae bacterium BRH_c16a]|nr:MAG: hypothetical protein VR65_27445 [Desulfobulbaceae bacterium BRH_c16a]
MERNEEKPRIFSLDNETGGYLAKIQDVDTARRFNCTLDCCENPVCTCGTVDITFIPLENGETDKPSPHRVSIDVIHRKLDQTKQKSVSRRDETFAQILLSGMNDADFQFLWKRYFTYKNKITENAPPDAIDAVFDFLEVEQDGLMYAYQDVLPYGDALSVRINGKNCSIYDHHCLLPKCSCTDTNLSFFPTEETETKGEELFSAVLNIKKKKWKAVEGGTPFADIESVRSAIEDQIPDIYQLLLKRQRKLKEIYVHCKKLHFKQPHRSTNVGRNDPCPCGSGKKYKKCCLAS